MLLKLGQPSVRLLSLAGHSVRLLHVTPRPELAARLGRVGRMGGRARPAESVAGSQSKASRVAGWSISLGQGAAMGGAALGLGALCWYGAGLSSRPSALDKSVAWPEFVRSRIRDTYGYFGVGVAATTAAAVGAFRSRLAMRLMQSGGIGTAVACAAVTIGSCIAVQMVPYSPGLGAKQLAWLGFSGVMGCMVAPVCLLGGQLVLRAAVTTAGIFGGLTAVAACAPDGKFLTWGGPLGIGLGVVFASSLGSAFLGPASALGVTLNSICLYGGLLLFSGFLLYDTQRVVQRAQVATHFDPVNSAIGIYLDALNIFVRVASIMAGGNRRK